ncbi:hypothetical protein TBLA_0A08040 [Henningerozyma blattae CBS 6284]|uniref:Protein ECM19 n=1 Tax=Henningerozyma blattae (strain ATCC 34711 / CBS 6284 / DSM 70876 / NBRC 10599 / NRRL Y-10934 / UCD 77-7) TaxID=1071380 RepID=I2GWU2_HENB6|nr:hypothetical protein TBLA_0A08040 [Tetrapisispora blattae CBS 6284]CCH58594.1 hypothetical protein TBLA_0A08040 [Tetrapisispora blattae CBS 6284]
MAGKLNGFNLLTLGVITVLGIYTGTLFFEPIILQQLEKDNNLKKGMQIPKYDSDGNPIREIPKSLQPLMNNEPIESDKKE